MLRGGRRTEDDASVSKLVVLEYKYYNLAGRKTGGSVFTQINEGR